MYIQLIIDLKKFELNIYETIWLIDDGFVENQKINYEFKTEADKRVF